MLEAHPTMHRRTASPDGRGSVTDSPDPAGAAGVPPQRALLDGDTSAAREHLAATSEVLAVLGRSGSDLEAILGAVVGNARQLCRADAALIYLLDGDTFRVARTSGVPAEVTAYIADHPFALDPGTLSGRVGLSRQLGRIDDVLDDESYGRADAQRVAGFRSVVAAPLLLDDDLVGVLNLWRTEVRPFGDRESTLLGTFASHAAVAIRNAHLVRALEVRSEELEIAGKHKSEFLASMSHELRTPLNAIIGFSEVLLERMFGDLNERQEQYLTDILASGRHLLELLNDILDLSKIEAGAMVLDQASVDVGDLVEHTAAMMRERAARRRLRLVVDVAPDAGYVRGDQLRIKQVVLNLLSNAVKFTPDGGTVSVSCSREGADVVVRVTDTGIGVPEQDRARIFDSFQQGSRPVGAQEGTGLGLTLCKQIVELHSGQIWVDSEVGQGSTFAFRLPAHLGPGAPTGDPTARDGRLVLLVEDDPSSVDLLRAYLTGSGYRVAVARAGETGLEAVQRDHPAAVVLDIQLPGMDGWAVLSRIRSDPVAGSTPVVVVSVVDERARGHVMGASAYLVKPVRRHEVLGELSRLVPAGTPDREARS